ncbi:TM2 domain-containing protein [Psychrosphaera ytuae]
MLSMDELKQEEDAIRKEITALPDAKRKEYYRLEDKRIKDPDTYAVLNYFFLAGLHHFYLGNELKGILNAMAMLIGIILFGMFGWVLILIVLIIELPQLFRSQTIVQAHNNKVMRETLNEVKFGRSQ